MAQSILARADEVMEAFAMSALGQKPKHLPFCDMSVLEPKADMLSLASDV
jgi:hypothetical protein